MSSLSAPLWPAGHLPHKGGDRMLSRPSPTVGVAGCAESLKLPISPLEGERPGRAEGGAS
ncbi:lytic murein transglycosylase [Mesorhizobium sp. M00.F.Ca.ET.186.01.1.1]|nr:lytic murein transglycosylase [bacterium M00.F.Ca.ET.205.01.1.1]TGU54615.1 lytic murein transglycosylase [bacterium M00.F.Ca.ET.152.01.1.1]TGV38607.1 lytic murein transglycosylase [Mesorhizobium sp. M00.F.Ca.ET.186.01.1.1]TGZ44187.1 lytic murein transglycosylase [bacterium M00.F.Ca.ET.162.01.1.1]